MEKMNLLNKDDLLMINGGDEYTYNMGYKIGEFWGKVGGMLDRFVEIFT